MSEQVSMWFPRPMNNILYLDQNQLIRYIVAICHNRIQNDQELRNAQLCVVVKIHLYHSGTVR